VPTRVGVPVVDTHGYPDFGMALAKALGFDLCHYLEHMRDRVLHVPIDHPVPAKLIPVIVGNSCLTRLELRLPQNFAQAAPLAIPPTQIQFDQFAEELHHFLSSTVE
jgi:hypothetical protein